MIKVDDLIQPRPEEIALPRLPMFLRPHESPRRRHQRSQGITARTPDQFARKPAHNSRNPANSMISRSPKITADQAFGSFSRLTPYLAPKCERSKRSSASMRAMSGGMRTAANSTPTRSQRPAESADNQRNRTLEIRHVDIDQYAYVAPISMWHVLPPGRLGCCRS